MLRRRVGSKKRMTRAGRAGIFAFCKRPPHPPRETGTFARFRGQSFPFLRTKRRAQQNATSAVPGVFYIRFLQIRLYLRDTSHRSRTPAKGFGKDSGNARLPHFMNSPPCPLNVFTGLMLLLPMRISTVTGSCPARPTSSPWVNCAPSLTLSSRRPHK